MTASPSHALAMSTPLRLLIINPNSSSSITDALSRVLVPHTPPNTQLTFWNPSAGPRGISDSITARQSCEACLAELPAIQWEQHDGVLVACFSEHPLIPALQQLGNGQVLVLGMFHAGVGAALLRSGSTGKFGIIATGTGEKTNLIVAVANFTGCKDSRRFAGVITTGLSVVELQEGDQVKVENGMKITTEKLVFQGAEVLILGCAGMSGMDEWVMDAAKRMGKAVKVVDGARCGVEMLEGLIRASR